MTAEKAFGANPQLRERPAHQKVAKEVTFGVSALTIVDNCGKPRQ
jgi:hypothetical protein